MARSPPPRHVLSARSLLKSTSLQPIIASRGGVSKEPDESARLSQVRYVNDHSSLSTPRNMYDDEDRSTIIPFSNNTQTHSLGGDSASILYNHDARHESALVPYSHDRHHDPYHSKSVPILYDPGHSHYWRRRRRRREQEKITLAAPCCYIFLKMLELMVTLAIVVVSRVWDEDLDLDIIYTAFGTVGLMVAGLGLLLIWVKGHPTPGECLHIMMLVCYGIALPVLLTGAIMVLLQSKNNLIVNIIAALFLLGTVLFLIDVIVMVTAILQCPCCCQYPYPHRPTRTHPSTRGFNDDDEYYSYTSQRHHHPHHPNHHRRHRSPHEHPRHYRNGYSSNPRSVPQMSVKTWHDSYRR